MKTNKHIFALYAPALSLSMAHKKNDLISLHDKDLYKRIFNVLRLEESDQVILFDKNYHAEICLSTTQQDKNMIVGAVALIEKNVAPAPDITLYQCVTKKNVFEDIVYTATQMGVQTIIPVISEKSERKWEPRETERLEKIIVAAIEQSKSFFFPHIAPAQKLSDILKAKIRGTNILFDAHGQAARTLLEVSNNQQINVMLGAEGGLTDNELASLCANGFSSYALTTSILRSRDAALVGLGLLRSLIRN